MTKCPGKNDEVTWNPGHFVSCHFVSMQQVAEDDVAKDDVP